MDLIYGGVDVGSVGWDQSGRAEARATLEVRGNGKLEAKDQVSVQGYDSSETHLYDQASGTFTAEACVVANDHSQAVVQESVSVLAFGRAKIIAFQSATVTLFDSATCDVRDPDVTVIDNRSRPSA